MAGDGASGAAAAAEQLESGSAQEKATRIDVDDSHLFVYASLHKYALVGSWALLAAFMLGLPLWAEILNNSLVDMPRRTAPHGLCSLAPADVVCSNGRNISQLLAAAGRSHACACGEGILGESICPISEGDFSLSGFVNTGTGTGIMASLSVFPVLGLWWNLELLILETGKGPVLTAAKFFLLSFNMFYLLFLMIPNCTHAFAHFIVTGAFVMSILLHMCCVGFAASRMMKSGSRVATIIAANSALGVAFLVFAYVASAAYDRMMDWPYGFWLGEALGLTFGFGIAPQIVLFGNVPRAHGPKFDFRARV